MTGSRAPGRVRELVGTFAAGLAGVLYAAPALAVDCDDPGLIASVTTTCGGPDLTAPVCWDSECTTACGDSCDSDADNVSNFAEAGAGTDPEDPDSDDDGLIDGDEIATGTFAAHAIGTEFAPIDIALGDLDGDTDLDLIVGYWVSLSLPLGGEVAWYENTDGAGTFVRRGVITGSHNNIEDVALADLDGDLDLDVIALSRDDATLAWYENTTGAGLFGPQQFISLVLQASSVDVGDFDGDTDLDLVTSQGNSTATSGLFWYENTDGLGTFSASQGIDQPPMTGIAIATRATATWSSTPTTPASLRTVPAAIATTSGAVPTRSTRIRTSGTRSRSSGTAPAPATSTRTRP